MKGAFSSRSIRYLLFGLMILLGVGVGLAYGWLVNPVQYVDTGPDTLREDFRADYALMVAEIYSLDQNQDLAKLRLGRLGAGTPLEYVEQAIQTASALGYDQADLETLNHLSDILGSEAPKTQGDLP
jgi:hypothetical protein